MAREFQFNIINSTLNIENRQAYTGSNPYQIRSIISSSEDSKLLIGNTEFRTSSINFKKTPNFSLQYQVIQSSGRTFNNKYFIEQQGNINVTSQSIGASVYFYDTNIETRPIQKTFFVNRFSAPGGPETGARLMLDLFGGEYSVYNNINYRNLLVRNKLNEWTAESSSIDSNIPSYHKFNKNPSYGVNSKYVFSGQNAYNDVFEDVVDYDSGFIQHQIPQSDKQYAWIKNSLQKEFIFEPQYRNELENKFNLGNGTILYDYALLNSTNVLLLYFKNNYVRLGHYRITTIGRSKTIKLIHEASISKQDFYAPSLSLFINTDSIYFTGLIAGFTTYPGQAGVQKLVLYKFAVNFNADSDTISGLNIESDTSLISLKVGDKGYNVSTSRNDYKYCLKTFDHETFAVAVCDSTGSSLDTNLARGRFKLGTWGSIFPFYSSINNILTSSIVGTNEFRTIRILPYSDKKFIITLMNNTSSVGTTHGIEYHVGVSYTNLSTITIDNSPPKSFLPYFNNIEYKYLTKNSTNNNVYYTFIADTFPQSGTTVGVSSKEIVVGLLAIGSSLTASRLFTQSIGTSFSSSVTSLNKFSVIANNNGVTSSIPYSGSTSTTEFDLIYFTNQISSSITQSVLETAVINISNNTLVEKEKYILYTGDTNYNNIFILPKATANSYDSFLFYQEPNDNDIYAEHCVVSKHKPFVFFVDEYSFNNSLEDLWKKQLFKNYSKFYDFNPELLEDYYFSYKNGLLDPLAEFCGTNISCIKDFDENTNTVSLTNSNNYLNFREYIANLNGFYGFSSWKQVHNQNNFFNLKLRLQNKYFVNEKVYLEPAISFQKPLEIKIRDSFGRIENLKQDYITKNNFFGNKDFQETFVDKKAIFEVLNTDTDYNKIKKTYNETSNFDIVKFTEQIFPKKKYISVNRIRKNYEEVDINKNTYINKDFWHNLAEERVKTLGFSYNNLNYINKSIIDDTPTKLKFRQFANNTIQSSSAGVNNVKTLPGFSFNINNSIWALDNEFIYQNKNYDLKEYLKIYDGLPTFLTKEGTVDTGSISGIVNSDNLILSSAYYANEFDTVRAIGDLSFPGYMEERKYCYNIPNNLFGISITPRTKFIFNAFSFHNTYEPFGMLYKTTTLSGKKPWYDSYEDYAQDIKLIGQNYSIIPEFNISSNLKKYLEEGSDFLNKEFLSLIGGDIESSLEQSTLDQYYYPEDSSPDYEYNIAEDFSNNIVYYSSDKNNQNIFDISLRYSNKFYDSTTTGGPYTYSPTVLGVTFKPDGTKMYTAGAQDTNAIAEYTFSTPWDIASISNFSQIKTINIDPLNGDPKDMHDVFWGNNGQKLYGLTSRLSFAKIYQWSPGVPYSLASINGTTPTLGPTQGSIGGTPPAPAIFDLSGVDDTARGMFISADGKKLFVSGLNSVIKQWTLATAWDVTSATGLITANLSSFILPYTSQIYLESISFSDDGYNFYVLSTVINTIFEFSLSLPYNIASTITLKSVKKIKSSEIANNMVPVGLYKRDLTYYVADYGNNKVYELYEDLVTTNKLIAVNIDLQKDTPNKEDYTLKYKFNDFYLDDKIPPQEPTSIIFETNDNKKLYTDITNINNVLSESFKVTSPNLTTSSFGTSIWFKVDKEDIDNKKPLGLFSYTNNNDSSLYDLSSLGVIINTSGSDLGDGKKIDTDIVVYNNGPHDTGINQRNIMTFYHNSSSVDGNEEYLNTKIQLDEGWHHLYLQYIRPQYFTTNYQLQQKQEENIIYPKSGLDDGYYKEKFINITSSFKDSINAFLGTSSTNNSIIANLNTYGFSGDSSDDPTDTQKYNVSIYNLYGKEYTLLKEKSFTPLSSVFSGSSTNLYTKRSHQDIRSLGRDSSTNDWFIIPYAYISLSNSLYYVKYEYVLGKYNILTSDLSFSGPKLLTQYQIPNNTTSSIYSFNSFPYSYDSSDGRCKNIVIEQTYCSGTNITSSLFSHRISYNDLTLSSGVNVSGSAKNSPISYPQYNATKILSIDMISPQTINNNKYPSDSFIVAWYQDDADHTKYYSFNSGASSFTKTFHGSSSNGFSGRLSRIKYHKQVGNVDTYVIVSNNTSSTNGDVSYGVITNSVGTIATSSIYSFTHNQNLSDANIGDDFYVDNDILILPLGTTDSYLSIWKLNTDPPSPISTNNFLYFTDNRFTNTYFVNTLYKSCVFNYTSSGSFNVPFTYFNTSSLERYLTTVKLNPVTGGNSFVKIYLDGNLKYGQNYKSAVTSTFNNVLLDNQPYWNPGNKYQTENNLNRLNLGQAINTQFTGTIYYKGQMDEVSLWYGVLNDLSVKDNLYFYGLGYATNMNSASNLYGFNGFNTLVDTPYISGFYGNIYGWYRIGYPKLKLSQNSNDIIYKYNEDFIEKYADTDLLSRYKKGGVVKTHYENILDDHKTEIQKISITVNGITKLLPYNGFYPSQRAAQIGKLFIDSFAKFEYFNDNSQNFDVLYVDSLGAQMNAESVTQAALQPFMAPGILFNSIKSGIAVDWPIFAASEQEANDKYKSSGDKPLFYRSQQGIEETVIYTTGIKYIIDTPQLIDTNSLNFSLKRIPFEALLDLDKLPKNGTKNKTDVLFYQDPTIYTISSELEAVQGSGDFQLNNSYPYFIWNGRKNDSLYELAMNNFISEIPRFFLKSQGLSHFISKPTKDLLPTVVGKRYYMDITLSKDKNFDLIIPGDKNSSGKYFGPPTNFKTNTQNLIKDPAYAPYTPPYFYGKRTLRLEYIATSPSSSITEIISKMSVTEIDTEISDFFSLNQGDLNSFAYQNKMPLTASIVINKTLVDPSITFTENTSNRQISNNNSDNEQNKRWVISTKWETPIINFNDKNSRNSALTKENSLNNTDVQGFIEGNTQFGAIEIKPTAGTGIWSGYSTDYNSGLKLTISNPFPESNNTSSLATLCGFEATSKNIGELATYKDFYEGIALIPYYDKTDERDTNDKFEYEKNDTDKFEFLEIDREEFKDSYEYLKANTDKKKSLTSIVDMIKKMELYEIPPHLDFLSKAKRTNFKDYNPFAIYIFEFSRKMDRKDLADMWQGILPEIGRSAQKDSVTIEHYIGERELIKEIKDPKHLKWLIFKVKRKAEKFYNNLTLFDDEKFKLLKSESDAENLGFNWPYDFCSLVELVNVDVSFSMMNEKYYKKEIPKLDKPPPAILVTPLPVPPPPNNTFNLPSLPSVIPTGFGNIGGVNIGLPGFNVPPPQFPFGGNRPFGNLTFDNLPTPNITPSTNTGFNRPYFGPISINPINTITPSFEPISQFDRPNSNLFGNNLPPPSTAVVSVKPNTFKPSAVFKPPTYDLKPVSFTRPSVIASPLNSGFKNGFDF